jgi:hypothetical protein
MVGQKGDRNDILHGKMGRTSMAFRLTDRSMISDIVESQRVSGDEQGLTGESPHCSLRFPEPLAPHQVGANLCQLFALCPTLCFSLRDLSHFPHPADCRPYVTPQRSTSKVAEQQPQLWGTRVQVCGGVANLARKPTSRIATSE